MPAATKRRRGYQVVARSSGVSEGVLTQMEAYMLPIGVGRKFSSSKSLVQLRDNSVAYSNIINSGVGYDGRPDALYNHTLILSNKSFASVGFDTRVLDKYFVKNLPRGDLPIISVKGNSPAPKINNNYRHLVLPVLRTLFERRNVAVSGVDDPSFLPNVLATLPPSMRAVPFSTCLPDHSKQPAYRLATYSGLMRSIPDSFVSLDSSSRGSIDDDLDDAIMFLVKHAASSGRSAVFSEFDRIVDATPRAKLILLSKIFGVSSSSPRLRAQRAEDALEMLRGFRADTQSRLLRRLEPFLDPKKIQRAKTTDARLPEQKIDADSIAKMLDGVAAGNKRRALKAAYGARGSDFEKNAGNLLASICDSPHAPDVCGFFAATPALHSGILEYLFGKTRLASKRRRRVQALLLQAALNESPELAQKLLERGAYEKHSKDDARDLRGILARVVESKIAGSDLSRGAQMSDRAGGPDGQQMSGPEPRADAQSAGVPCRQPVRRFRDPIHGFIDVYANEMSVIQDPVFQRLRRIKQLSFAHLVYHGAEHSRFGHVLGTMHLADRALRSIKDNSEKSGGGIVDDADIRAARLAALLHDVGHRPFSHALDWLFEERGAGSHEDLSEALVLGRFAPMIETAEPDGADPKRVADLIRGRLETRKPFMTQLISGQLDVDKMDYLLRDSHYAGVKYGAFDLDMLMDSLVLTEGNLAVSSKGFMAAEQMIIARHHMFGQVYHHKTKRSFENMAQRAAGLLLERGDLEYPSAKSLLEGSDDLAAMDDAWLMKKIESIEDDEMADVVNHIRARKPFKEVLSSDDLVPKHGSSEAAIGYFEAITESLSANLGSAGLEPSDIALDRSSVLPYRLFPYAGDPDEYRVMINYSKSGQSVPIEQKSEVVKAIAQKFIVHRMFVHESKADDLKKYLKQTHHIP